MSFSFWGKKKTVTLLLLLLLLITKSALFSATDLKKIKVKIFSKNNINVPLTASPLPIMKFDY